MSAASRVPSAALCSSSTSFYDLTTVEISGQAVVADDVRAFGRAKSGLVARQFVLSLVQTAEGLPIAHEVHPVQPRRGEDPAADD